MCRENTRVPCATKIQFGGGCILHHGTPWTFVEASHIQSAPAMNRVTPKSRTQAMCRSTDSRSLPFPAPLPPGRGRPHALGTLTRDRVWVAARWKNAIAPEPYAVTPNRAWIVGHGGRNQVGMRVPLDGTGFPWIMEPGSHQRIPLPRCEDPRRTCVGATHEGDLMPPPRLCLVPPHSMTMGSFRRPGKRLHLMGQLAKKCVVVSDDDEAHRPSTPGRAVCPEAIVSHASGCPALRFSSAAMHSSRSPT